MPERKKHVSTILLNIIVILFIITEFTKFAVVVSADNSKSYYISNYNVLVNINKDGSANIEEHITYSFSGKFNGITLDIDLSGTNGIEKTQVFINRNGSEIKAEESSSGAQSTYTYNLANNTAKFKVYEPSFNEEKTFVFKYNLIDAVTKYNDIAEFNRKMIGTSWDVRINNIYIKISIPEGVTKEDIRVFGHGPLTGESEIIDSRNIEFKVPAVSAGTFVETRVMFPNKLVPDSKNIVPKDALQDILTHEKKLAQEANLERERAREYLRQRQEKQRKLSLIGSILFGIFLPLWFVLILHIYLKYDREFRHGFFGQYYRELPGEYTPAEMSVLMSMGRVHPRDIMATLMDLVRKRYLLLEEVSVDRKSLFGTKKINNYMISLNDEKPLTGLKSHESFLVNCSLMISVMGMMYFWMILKNILKRLRLLWILKGVMTFGVKKQKWKQGKIIFSITQRKKARLLA